MLVKVDLELVTPSRIKGRHEISRTLSALIIIVHPVALANEQNVANLAMNAGNLDAELCTEMPKVGTREKKEIPFFVHSIQVSGIRR